MIIQSSGLLNNSNDSRRTRHFFSKSL